MIEQTRFLSSAFLCSELKLKNIYSGVNFLGKKMFAVIFIGGNFFLRVAKIRTLKNFPPHGTQKTIQQLVKGLACVCQDIEHPGSLESTKEV